MNAGPPSAARAQSVFCVQLDIAWENKPANFKRAHELLAAAKLPAGALVLLPEMFATGFSMHVEAIAEAEPSGTEAWLARTAQEFQVYLMGGVVREGTNGRGRNQSVIFSPEGRRLARYTKIQPFSLAGESEAYSAGKTVVTFSWHGWTVAPFICYDLRFPELFRAAVRKGAQLMLVIANWPAVRIHHWRTLLQARAIENQAYVAGVNRCGRDPKIEYGGHSLVVDPHGNILAEAGTGEEVCGAGVDLKALARWRAEFPALRDMRARPRAD